MNKILILLIISIFLINSCNLNQNGNIECNKNSDCAVGGCSNQVCAQQEKINEIITTCEYKEEYNCLKETSCLCVDNKCKFEENENYLKCLSKIK